MENMEHEKKFVDLLGFSIINTEKKDYYKIVDKNNHDIGFIKREMVKKSVNDIKNGKRLPPIFGYHMKFDTDYIHYDSIREFNNRLDKYFDIYDTSFYYEFIVSNENLMSFIKLTLGEKIRLVIKNNKYGYIQFELDKEKLYLSLKTKTTNSNCLETVLIKASKKDKNPYKGSEYVYNITYCDKDTNLNKRIGRKTEEYLVRRLKNPSVYDEINVIENNWENGSIINYFNENREGTVSKFIKENGKGLNLFNQFRQLIAEIIPIEKDIIMKLFEDYGIEQPLSLVIPDLEKIDLAGFDEVYNIKENVKLAIKIIGKKGSSYITNAYVIYNNQEIYEFSKPINMKFKDSRLGFYSWNEDYIYKFSYDGLLLDCFSISKKENITNENKMKSI